MDYERLSEPVRQIYSEMQGDLLEAIVKRLAGDHDLLENEEFMEWHFRKLNQLDGLNREAIRIIAKRTGVAEKALIEALRRAGFEAKIGRGSCRGRGWVAVCGGVGRGGGHKRGWAREWRE